MVCPETYIENILKVRQIEINSKFSKVSKSKMENMFKRRQTKKSLKIWELKRIKLKLLFEVSFVKFPE